MPRCGRDRSASADSGQEYVQFGQCAAAIPNDATECNSCCLPRWLTRAPEISITTESCVYANLWVCERVQVFATLFLFGRRGVALPFAELVGGVLKNAKKEAHIKVPRITTGDPTSLQHLSPASRPVLRPPPPSSPVLQKRCWRDSSTISTPTGSAHASRSEVAKASPRTGGPGSCGVSSRSLR